MKKVPQRLQPFLWSVEVKDLDLKKDKAYIINQLLAYGGLKDLKWLFKTYSKQVVKNTFINHPVKVYTSSGFNFIKQILLELKDKKLDSHYYDRNLPRLIRR